MFLLSKVNDITMKLFDKWIWRRDIATWLTMDRAWIIYQRKNEIAKTLKKEMVISILVEWRTFQQLSYF